MEQFEEGERYARSNFLLAGWVETSTKELHIPGDFAVTGTVAKRDLMYAGSMYYPKSFVAGRRRRASHAGVIEVNDKTNFFECCPLEERAMPLL